MRFGVGAIVDGGVGGGEASGGAIGSELLLFSLPSSGGEM